MFAYSEEDIRKILATAVGGGDHADLYLSRSLSGVIAAEDHRLSRFYRGSDEGAGIRVLKDDFSAYFYTNDISPKGLMTLAERAKSATAGGESPVAVAMKPPQTAVAAGEKNDLTAIGAIIRRLNDAAWQWSDAVHQVSISFGDVNEETLTAATDGRLVRRTTARKRFFVEIVAKGGNDLQRAIETLGDTETVFSWSEERLWEKVRSAAERAEHQLKAADAPAGKMPVVMSAAAGGTMVHEACGHGLEGDSVSKGLSVYKDKLGEKVAARGVTVIDDATLAGHYGSYAYDDEGHAGRRNVLIEKGVLKQYMQDVRAARRVDSASTGNGRRESYRCAPQTRMSNTFIAPGDDDPAAIVADVKKGFFVKKMGGGQVNTVNGDFVFEVSEGYLIERGELTTAVKNASLIGNGPKALSSVFAVGNDLGFAIGTCGKGGQSVPVGDAQPTIGIAELVIGGKG